jgi:hypothetical protein
MCSCAPVARSPTPPRPLTPATDGVEVGRAHLRAAGPRIQVSGVEPRAEVQLRSGGEVVDTARANPQGRVTFAPVEPGNYTAVQVVDGQRSLLSEGVTVDGRARRGASNR